MGEKEKNKLYGNNEVGDDSYTSLRDEDYPNFTFEDSGKNDYAMVSDSVKKKKVDEKFDQKFFESVMNDKKANVKAFAWVSFFIIVLVGLIIFTYNFVNQPLEDDNLVYSGVLVNGHDLGGMTKDEVIEYVTKTYVDPINNANIIVKLGDNEKPYPLSNFVVCPDPKAIAEKAYGIGRTGTDSEKITEIKALESNPVSIAIEYSVVAEDMTEVIALAAEQGYEVAVNPTYDIREEGVVFTSGKPGLSVDKEKFTSDLSQVLVQFEKDIANIESQPSLADKTIEVSLVEADFVHLDQQKILDESFREATAASYAKRGDKVTDDIYVLEGTQGRTLNVTELAAIISRINAGENIPYYLLEYEYFDHEITVETLSAELFVDILSKVNTTNKIDKYSGIKEIGLENRQMNIARACKLLGEVELLPGYEIKLSEVIGKLSAENGFFETYENSANGGRETIGGGINQFATALYEAAAKANLSTQSVHSTYYPYYGTPGFDAIYDNNNDFVIYNTTGKPIRICTSFRNNELTVTIYGTQDPAKLTELYAEGPVLSTTSRGIRYTYTIYRDVGVTKVDMGIVQYEEIGGKMPTATPDTTPEPTSTPEPTTTPEPTNTSEPTATPTPTETPEPVETPEPTTEQPE